MGDPRVDRHAKLLVRYSTRIKKGERVIVKASAASAPLILALQREILDVGAFPVLRISVPGQSYNYYSHAKQHHLEDLSPISRYEVRKCQVNISIYDDTNTHELSSIDPEKIAVRRKTYQPLSDYILRNIRWCGTLFPTDAFAQDADMSLREYEDFVYKAMFCDKKDPIKEWKKISAYQEKLAKRLNKAKTVQIIGRETDLTMDVEGRTFVNSDGRYNMPSGEVFTAPHIRSVEGHILYDDFPTIYGGKEVQGVYLEFKRGKVVKATAEKNEDYLLKMLDIDKGARYLGELGIGTNFGIQRFTKNILFDEKIGGTIHLALGRAYEECGGKNKSALHWDMIKDLRKHGELLVDGKKMKRKNGRLYVSD